MRNDLKRVLLVAHDRGGVNQLVPLLSAWRQPGSGISAEFLGTPMIEWEVASAEGADRSGRAGSPAMPRASQWLMNANGSELAAGRGAWTVSHDHLRAVLQQGWDLVLTGTSMLSRLETTVWRVCHEHSIPCVAICDMWSEYRRRVTDEHGTAPLPLLLVIDERMQKEARAELGKDLRIKVVGSPHFNRLLVSGQRQQQERANIRFVSEPVASLFPDTGLHEFYVAAMLIAARDKLGSDAPVVLRPHPQDNSEAWRRFVYDYRARNVRLDDEPSWHCHTSTHMALGMSSMMLIELAIAGIPVASFQPPQAGKAFFCLDEDEFGISIVTDLAELDAWFAAPKAPHVREPFVQRHMTAIDEITALVRDGRLFD